MPRGPVGYAPMGGTLRAGGECNKALFGGSNPSMSEDMQRNARARLAASAGGREPPYTAGLVSQRPALGCLFEIVETLVLTLIIFFVIQNFVAQPYKVQQLSMERTLEPEQYVLVDKLTPRFDTYKRGDIVVFEPPEEWGDEQTPFIKRVIGQPNDTIEIRDDGLVYVNDVVLVEPYLYSDEPGGDPQPTSAPLEQSLWTVPAGELFLMGDHRSNSADSRTFGPVPIERVIGRAWLRYWPLDTFGPLRSPTYADLTSPAPSTAAPSTP